MEGEEKGCILSVQGLCLRNGWRNEVSTRVKKRGHVVINNDSMQ